MMNNQTELKRLSYKTDEIERRVLSCERKLIKEDESKVMTFLTENARMNFDVTEKQIPIIASKSILAFLS